MLPEDIRYSCQLALPGFGHAGQQQLKVAKVLIVGAGGLGCPVAQYLAAAGVGVIGIADDDAISVSNLHRQILYSEGDVGLRKVIVACKKLQAQNPHIKLVMHDTRITSDNVRQVISGYDIVVDGTDNFDTKYLLNDACVLAGKPLIYGAIYQYEGQVAVWNTLNEDGGRSVNYRDLFPEVNATQVPNCVEGGVISTLAGIIGCMQANEVIKMVTGVGELLTNKILIFDARTMQSRIIKLSTKTSAQIGQLTSTVNVPTISIATFRQNSEAFELIDVRTSEERDLYNIGGKHIPLTEIENLHLANEKPLVLYCASGKRSAEAVKQITRKNASIEIYSLEGGIKAWQEAG